MIVARSLTEIRHEPNSVVTVGTFDGVHVGHRAIIREVTSRAASVGGRSVVVTFDPHPRQVVGKGPVKLLSSLEERIDILDQLGIQQGVVLPFTYEFSRRTPREFYEEYVVRRIGVREVVVGYDHMFGRDREAGIGELRRMGPIFGFQALMVEPVTIDGQVVSSSAIRECLSRGDVETAARFLTIPYHLLGSVVPGDARGASLGFPTANLQVQSEAKLVPANGVYCARVGLEGRTYYGMLNIGTRPTFRTGAQTVLEVHIFDFSGDIYGKILRVDFLNRLRSERRFSSPGDLIAQLEADRNECLRIVSSLQLS